MHILNTVGAARYLGVSDTWVHRLVASGRLKAYIYSSEGKFVPHRPHEKKRGQGLHFFEEDLQYYKTHEKRGRGRPPGSQNNKKAIPPRT